MKTIHKYRLDGVTNVQMRKGAEILDIQIQKTTFLGLYVWALVDTEIEEKEERYFLIYGTGQKIDESLKLKYITTLQLDGAVWHVFENIR